MGQKTDALCRLSLLAMFKCTRRYHHSRPNTTATPQHIQPNLLHLTIQPFIQTHRRLAQHASHGRSHSPLRLQRLQVPALQQEGGRLLPEASVGVLRHAEPRERRQDLVHDAGPEMWRLWRGVAEEVSRASTCLPHASLAKASAGQCLAMDWQCRTFRCNRAFLPLTNSR